MTALWWRAAVAVFTCGLVAPPASAGFDPSENFSAPIDSVVILQIRILEGEGGVHAAGTRAIRPLSVQITDAGVFPDVHCKGWVDVFGKEFASSIFISEPVHNLVHREMLQPDGVSFTSHRADDEATSEFLASRDRWFRPTMVKTGPDGALYIADMYRLVIEHPQWIPAEMQKVE